MVVVELDNLRLSSDVIDSGYTLSQLSSQSSYSFENDFLKETERKCISDVKNCSEQRLCQLNSFGPDNYKSPCMKNGHCSKKFPKKFCSRTFIDDDGFPHYRRRNDGSVVKKNGVKLDNRYVVPYNTKLLLKYQAHIKVEYTCQNSAIKYLFKYIHKGQDRVTAAINHSDDEIKIFYDCRYVSACEAAWRIFGFEIHYRFPPVQRFSFHLPNEKSVVFSDHASITDVKTRVESRQSMFESWMDANKKYPEGKNLTYAEYPTQFVYKESTHEWHPKKQGFSIGRINRFSANNGEDSYVRTLLNFQKGCTSYEDLRTVNGVLFPTYKDVCYSLGLLDDDNEYIDAIEEASSWGSATYLRNLFALLLFGNSMNRPENVFQKCWELLSDDVLYRHRQRIGREEIDKVLQSNGKCLSDYPSMPSIMGESLLDMQNRLVMDELLYDSFSLKEEHHRLLNSLTDEQRVVYEKKIPAVSAGKGGFFFLYGFGGTGKTFIWNTLSAFVRSRAEIVLNVASSAIASLILPGGRTAHSRFRIPIQITEDSTCNIKQNFTLAELLSKTKLIIWDEAPMVHKFCFEALDRTLRDVLSCVDMPFGGKVVVLGGDFRQILPVIPNGSRQDIVHATINSSYLWSHCHLLSLTKNMHGNSSLDDDEISPDILNTFSCSGIPDHKLTLKVKVPVMLLRNIDQSRGLCNGTRLLITKLGNHVVEAIVLTGNNIGDIVLIPRMTISPSGHTFPVNFQRRQFPLVVSFAMTINKSQGQSLSHVGIYLPRSVFTHGQLYAALSRVKSRHGLKMLILDENGCVTNTTFNIVYKEIQYSRHNQYIIPLSFFRVKGFSL
ncbi:uncharacterized protein LOC133310559 [Gastrolobium bilobum]|uniref:uncharacterized protein LOC133310559 n=1 Tax=Gastrolobium bilobum TaxID=150636 RepID=UPI002AB305E0|nr:uncharacterized protein LOC133310559 [Gastrolobium bilobum]